MADLPESIGATGDDTGVGPGRGATSGAPRWVKALAISALVLVVLVVILLLTGGGPGGHGPGRHASSGDAGGRTSPSSVMDSGGVGGHRPPSGGHTP